MFAFGPWTFGGMCWWYFLVLFLSTTVQAKRDAQETHCLDLMKETAAFTKKQFALKWAKRRSGKDVSKGCKASPRVNTMIVAIICNILVACSQLAWWNFWSCNLMFHIAVFFHHGYISIGVRNLKNHSLLGLCRLLWFNGQPSAGGQVDPVGRAVGKRLARSCGIQKWRKGALSCSASGWEKLGRCTSIALMRDRLSKERCRPEGWRVDGYCNLFVVARTAGTAALLSPFALIYSQVQSD